MSGLRSIISASFIAQLKARFKAVIAPCFVPESHDVRSSHFCTISGFRSDTFSDCVICFENALQCRLYHLYVAGSRLVDTHARNSLSTATTVSVDTCLG